MTVPAAQESSPQEPVDLQVESSEQTGEGPAVVPPLESDRASQLIARLLRVAYPHTSFPDGPYERTAHAVLEAAAGDEGDQRALSLGLQSLDVAAHGDFLAADHDAAEALLRNVADDVFFVRIRRTAVVAFYDDTEVWELLGYEGSSFHEGGYRHRGFDDLDWLPPARIEEYADPPRVELVTDEGARS